jgi:group I intron endonuclease
MKVTGIYQIKSIVHPERIYVGSAININRRWNQHLRDLKNFRHHSLKLQNHYNKYGVNDLIFILIEECTKENLIIREQFYLNITNTYFNICKTAGNCLGRIPWNKNSKMSKDFSEKMKHTSTGNNNRKGKFKLTENKINEICIKYIPRKYTANMLAQEYGICKDTVFDIIYNKKRFHNTKNA